MYVHVQCSVWDAVVMCAWLCVSLGMRICVVDYISCTRNTSYMYMYLVTAA